MARDSWLKRLIWLRGSPAGGSGASYEKTVGPAPIISISDAKAKPAKSLIVGMEPIQAGSGDPSPDNIRPISGRTGVTVDHSGADTSDPQTYHVMFPDGQTVYGGTVDVVTGEGSIDWVGLTLDGVNKSLSVASTSYIGATTTRGYITNPPYTSKAGVSSMEAWSMCSAAKFIVSTADNGVQAYYIGLNGTEINFRILNSLTGVTSEDTAAQARTKINAYLAENPITVVYAVKDPVPFTLSPTQIQLLKGSNTLWSDADDLTLTYLGTTPPNLLGGMLGGGLGGGYNPPAEQDPNELTEPEATETDEPAEETLAEEGENNGE